MTQVKTTHLAMCVIAAILLGVSSLAALTLKKASLEELTRESSLVIQGRVISAESRWEDERRQSIYTVLTIEVEQYVKGSGPKAIQVKQLGGAMEDIALEVSGSPRLGEGDEVLLFLQSFQGAYWIHSIALGYYQVIREKDGQQYVLNDLRGINLVDASALQKVSPAEAYTFEPLPSFVSRVRQYVD